MNATELFERHVASALAQYRGSFQSLEKILQAGEMPDITEPTVRANVEQLQRFLSTQGVPEDDEFLLGFGLVAPGAHRGIHPPVSVLSPDRGGFSQRRLQEAAGQVGRLREALTLGYQFFPDLSRDTAIALQELSRRACPTIIADEEWVHLHADLPTAQAGELASLAFGCLGNAAENVREVGISVLGALADFRQEGLGALTTRLVEHQIFRPPSLYRSAPAAVANLLIHRLDAADRVLLNHLLLALAWSRGEVAHHAFVQWRRRPPPWASRLHVPPETYLQEAGWSLKEDGSRYELISSSCHRIRKVPQPNDEGLAVPCRTPAEGCCPACGGGLSWLFDFSLIPERFFSGDRLGAPRKLLCCLNCACFSPVFSRYSADGTVQWHPGTAASKTAPTGTWSPCMCQLTPAAFSPFAAARPFLLDDATILGGMPMWLQDSEYPRCPDCTNPMQFLAQFDNSAMPEPEEGIYYGFFCASCRVAAVSYQQT